MPTGGSYFERPFGDHRFSTFSKVSPRVYSPSSVVRNRCRGWHARRRPHSIFIYSAGKKAAELWRDLVRRCKRRRPLRSGPARDLIKDRASIHERPTIVGARDEAGHWEADLIICKRTRPVLVLHERKSRLTLAARLAGKTAAETISHACRLRSNRPGGDLRQRHGLRAARDAAIDASDDHMVLRCLRVVAKRRRRKRQRQTVTLVAA
jgi:hypothetical protein